ncbi:flippase [Candidatus Micrarchaeota archaeon]|nr:flippase [Candidatus Micrarchaeota archaeon]
MAENKDLDDSITSSSQSRSFGGVSLLGEDNSGISTYSNLIAKGSIWNLIGQFFFKFSSFLYVILIARMASQDDIGIFYLSLSVMTILALFTEFGILGSISRYVPFFHGKGMLRKIHDLFFISHISIILSLIVAFIVFFNADFLSQLYRTPVLADGLRFFSVYLVLGVLYQLNYALIGSLADVKMQSLLQNLQNFVKLLLTFTFFVFFGASLFTLCAGYILSFVPSWIWSVFVVRKHFSSIPKLGDPLSKDQFLREIIPFGFMLTLLNSFYAIVSSSDRLLLGYLIPPDQSSSMIAMYTVATTFVSVIGIIPSSVGGIFFPIISRLIAKNDSSKVAKLMETSERWILLASLPLSLVFISFSRHLLVLFYGGSYADASLAMSIFGIGLAIQYISYIISLILASMRLVMIELKVLVFGALANVVLGFLLIPSYGMIGAAISSAISFTITTLLLVFYAKKLLNFTYPNQILRIYLSGVILLLILLVLNYFSDPVFDALSNFVSSLSFGSYSAYVIKILNLSILGLLVGISSILFFLISIFFKCLHSEDVSLLKSILRKGNLPPNISGFIEKVALMGVSDN